MLYAGAALATVLVALPPGAVTSPPLAAPPPVTPVTVEVVEGNGSGCPDATSRIQPDWSGNRVTFYYTDYLAGVGPLVRPTDYRKHCRLVLNVVPPPGYTFAVTTVTHRGSAILEPGASGTWQAVHHFDDAPAPEPTQHTFAGPLDDMWERAEQTPPDALAWASCDNPRPLVISSRLTVHAGTADPTTTSWLVMDGIDILPNEYQLAWRPCAVH